MPQRDDPALTRALTQKVTIGGKELGPEGGPPVEIIGFAAALVVGNKSNVLKSWMLEDGYTERRARRKAHSYVRLKRAKHRKRRYVVIRLTRGGGEHQEPDEAGNGGEE